MPYYVNQLDLSVVVTAPGSAAPAHCAVIDGDTVSSCGGLLQHKMALTEEQVTALLQGDVAAFMNEPPPSTLERRQAQEMAAKSPALPPAGRWEYKVIPMTELLGLATAKGTAQRMEAALNSLAADGWELVTTTERDSRFLGGETVLLTLRRYVVTEHMFMARLRAEERIRATVQLEGQDSRRSDDGEGTPANFG